MNRNTGKRFKVFVTKFDPLVPLEWRISEALAWLGWEKIIGRDARVFLKPNLTWREPMAGVTTTLTDELQDMGYNFRVYDYEEAYRKPVPPRGSECADLSSRYAVRCPGSVLTNSAGSCRERAYIAGCLSGRDHGVRGDQSRPVLHVKDVARVVTDHIETKHTGVYVLHRENVRIYDLAERIRNHFPDLTVKRTEMSFEDARN